jgi:hypothetical protein
MAKVIRIDKKQQKKVTHKECGAVVEYFENEVQSYTHHDYGGGSDEVYYLKCPNCGQNIILRRY